MTDSPKAEFKEPRTVIAVPHQMPAAIWRFDPRTMDREEWQESLDDLASNLPLETLEDIASAARYIVGREHQWVKVTLLLAQAVAEEFDEIDVRVCRDGHSLAEKAKTFPDREAVDEYLLRQMDDFTDEEIVEGRGAVVVACIGHELFEVGLDTGGELKLGFTDDELRDLVDYPPHMGDDTCVHFDVNPRTDKGESI
jgi:hypothetical protein